jgi:hypothetical protein
MGTPQRSLASFAEKYQPLCSLNISHKFSGFFGGGVAQLVSTTTQKNKIKEESNLLIKAKINFIDESNDARNNFS